jgi:hypothetical protein
MTSNRAGIIQYPVTGASDAAVRSDPRGIPDPALAGNGPQVAPGLADELLGRQCTRCGAVGTHYLTCPGLRLPSGFRLS